MARGYAALIEIFCVDAFSISAGGDSKYPIAEVARSRNRLETVAHAQFSDYGLAMKAEQIPSIQTLSLAEKYLLANELWQEVADDESMIPLGGEVEQLLEKRQEEFLANPDDVISWEEIKEKLKNR